MIVVEPATLDTMTRFYGHPPSRTARAIVARDGDRVLGVAGLYRAGDRHVAFIDMTDEVRARRRVIVLGARALRAMMAEAGGPVHALADPHIEGSDRLLEHYGFEPLEGRVYEWRG